MSTQAPVRGWELVGGGSRLGFGPQWLARVFSGSIDKIVDRIDAGMLRGSIEASLPDGSMRRVGGRGEGTQAHLILRDWRAVLRLATGGSVGWYQAWVAGEWDSPD
ncbi:MAG: class SAM-dependent methyltransferase, partial [Novosphingobium sp.]|nr:class SAM-dependent methyltransferase [Novosphingobium sp.]